MGVPVPVSIAVEVPIHRFSEGTNVSLIARGVVPIRPEAMLTEKSAATDGAVYAAHHGLLESAAPSQTMTQPVMLPGWPMQSGSQLGSEKQQRELTAGFAGGALVLLLAGCAMSLRWFGRPI